MGKRSLMACGMSLLLPVGAGAQDNGGAGTLFVDYAVETGWPVSTIQTVSVARLTLELAFPLSSGDAWHLEYPISFFVARARNNPGLVPVVGGWEFPDLRGPPKTAHGVGVHPLGLRVVRTTGRVAFYTGMSAGIIFFDKPTPGPNARRENFTGDFELGTRITVSGGLDLVLGYQYNHLSNASTADNNRGIDSHMVRVGIRRW